MKEIISHRFASLATDGEQLVRRIPYDRSGLAFWVEAPLIPQYQAWLSGVANLIDTVASPGTHYRQQVRTVLDNDNMKNGIPATVVQQVQGLLVAAKQDWEAGLLRRVEYIFAAQTFDDFLDHASAYHKAGKKIEAGVLASAVLEDTIKKLAIKHTLPSSGQSLEQLIDKLVTAEVLTPVKAKRVKSWAGVRNQALHAAWDAFDVKDVGTMIAGIREVIADYL